MVLDPESPQVERVDQLSFKSESESILDDGVHLPTKRATIFWEGTLEDVMEDEEELVEEGTKENQEEADPTNEMESQLEGEDSDIIIKKEEYQVRYVFCWCPCVPIFNQKDTLMSMDSIKAI